MSSPRNSITPVVLNAADAAKLAAEIREDIASAPPPREGGSDFDDE